MVISSYKRRYCNWKMIDLGFANRSGTLLSIHDPARFVFISKRVVNRNNERPEPAVTRTNWLNLRWFKAHALIEGDHDRVRNHWIRRFQVSADFIYVR